MMKSAMLVSAASMALCLAAGPSAAAVITYTLSGDFAISAGRDTVRGEGVFVGIGDTALPPLTDPNADFLRPLSSLTFTLGGVNYGSTYVPYFFNNQTYGTSGFGAISPDTFGDLTSQDVFDFKGLSTSYDGNGPYLTTSVTVASFQGDLKPFRTDKGPVLFLTSSNLIFSAVVLPAPEPSSWAMMLAGFGLIGLALRDRREGSLVRYA